MNTEIPNYPLKVELKFFATFEKDAEALCRKYYEELGFLTFKTNNKKAFKKLISSVMFPDFLKRMDINAVGIPDFLVYKPVAKEGKIAVEEYFFVEAKSHNDFLSQVQVEWILKRPNIKVIVFWLKQPKHDIYEL